MAFFFPLPRKKVVGMETATNMAAMMKVSSIAITSDSFAIILVINAIAVPWAFPYIAPICFIMVGATGELTDTASARCEK